MKHGSPWNSVAFLLLSCALTMTAQAASPTTLPSVFADHMVLQRDIPLPFWGRAEAGAKITVSTGDASETAIADSMGAWSLKLPARRATDIPMDIKITDDVDRAIVIRDVLVGDVWVASGQSNMEFALKKASNAASELPKADHPTMRLFQVRRRPGDQPQFTCDARWAACTPESAGNFSAVAYLFGREIQESEGVPIGIIGTYAGGTKAEAWMSLNGFTAAPALKRFSDEIEQLKAKLPALQERYTNEQLPAWQKAHDEWDRAVGPAYREDLKQWSAQSSEARAAGKSVPPKPRPAQPEPKKPDPPKTNPHGLSVLYNGMVAPVVPFGIKGVIWYQGESNADDPVRYGALFPALIADWRGAWNQPGDAGSLTHDFPFLFVQLPNFVAYPDSDWPGLREAQVKTLDIAVNTAMAVAIDTADPTDLHPRQKAQVAHRLALAAQHVAYGKTDVAYASPMFETMSVDGDRVRVTFKNAGGGLVIGGAASTRPGGASDVMGFEIAGADGVYARAAASIADASSVVMSSEKVPHPTAVRYAWANVPSVNLYNREGLPAVPFRTDKAATAW